MRLTELLTDNGTRRPAPKLSDDPEIAGLTADSRAVSEGYLFAALPGSSLDGRRFIGHAIERGAVAILAPAGTSLDHAASGRPVQIVTDDNPRRRLALMAARFFGGQPRIAAAVTGTNAKTSVASFTRQIWTELGHRAASLGTLGLVAPDAPPKATLTTPDPVGLHAELRTLADDRVDHVVLEASSHGIEQSRLDGVVFSAGAFTNLTRDHLDYHGSFDAYRAAKLRLFDTVLPEDAVSVLNADADDFETFETVCRARGIRTMSYGVKGEDLRVESIQPRPEGQLLTATVFGTRYEIELPLPGAFQAGNALCALGLVVACGDEPSEAVETLSRLTCVPGRLELVARRANGAPVYVDYAHTPDALESVLRALRPHTAGRLVVVFGCGGDRDRGKRPLMGEIAARLADIPVVTDDNPRGEDPAAIRREILAACPGALEYGDRAEAIREAVSMLAPDDLLVVAGKGHETGQIVGDTVRPFDDAVCARDAVAACDGEPS